MQWLCTTQRPTHCASQDGQPHLHAEPTKGTAQRISPQRSPAKRTSVGVDPAGQATERTQRRRRESAPPQHTRTHSIYTHARTHARAHTHTHTHGVRCGAVIARSRFCLRRTVPSIRTRRYSAPVPAPLRRVPAVASLGRVMIRRAGCAALGLRGLRTERAP